MRRFRKAVAASAAVMVITAGVAAAVTEYPEGGRWDHGVSGGIVWSHYSHPTRPHRVSVVGSDGLISSQCVPAGRTARIDAPARWYWPDKVYYSFCD